MGVGPIIVLLPFEPGRKHRHLAIASHYGGGWWEIACMGEGKRCREGVCKHTANFSLPNGRRVRQVAR